MSLCIQTLVLLSLFRFSQPQCNTYKWTYEFDFKGQYTWREKSVDFIINMNGPEFWALPLDFERNMPGWYWQFTGLKTENTKYLAWWRNDFFPTTEGNSFCVFQEGDAIFSENLRTLMIRKKALFYLFQNISRIYHWVQIGQAYKWDSGGSSRFYVTILHLSFQNLPPVYGIQNQYADSVPALYNSPTIITCEFKDPQIVMAPNKELHIFRKHTIKIDQQPEFLYFATSDPGKNIFDTGKGKFVGQLYNFTNRVTFVKPNDLTLLTFRYAEVYDSGEYYCNLRDNVDNSIESSRPFMLGVHNLIIEEDLYLSAARYIYTGETYVHFYGGFYKSMPVSFGESRVTISNSPFCTFVCASVFGMQTKYNLNYTRWYFECAIPTCNYDIKFTTIENMVVSRRNYSQIRWKSTLLTNKYVSEIYTGYRIDVPSVNSVFEPEAYWENYIVVIGTKDHSIMYWIKDSDRTPQDQCLDKCFWGNEGFREFDCIHQEDRYEYIECVDRCLYQFHTPVLESPPPYIWRPSLEIQVKHDASPNDYLENRLKYYILTGPEEFCVPLNILMYVIPKGDTVSPSYFRWLPIEFVELCHIICHDCSLIKPYLGPFMQPLDRVKCISSDSFVKSMIGCQCFKRCIFLAYLKLDDQRYGPRCGMTTSNYIILYMSHKKYYFNPGFNQEPAKEDIDTSRKATRFLAESEGTIFAKVGESATFRCAYPKELYVGDEPPPKGVPLKPVQLTYLFFPGEISFRKNERGIKLFDVLFIPDKPFANYTSIRFSPSAQSFYNNTYAFHEGNEVYIIIKNILLEYDGLFECMVHYGDFLHQFSITTVLRVYEKDRVWDTNVRSRSNVESFIFVEGGKPAGFLIKPYLGSQTNLITLALWRKPIVPSTSTLPEYATYGTLRRQFKQVDVPGTGKKVIKEIAPDVQLQTPFDKELTPNDFRFVHGPREWDKDVFLLIKRMPDESSDWAAKFNDYFFYLTYGDREELTNEYDVQMLTWTDQFYQPLYQVVSQWNLQIVYQLPNTDHTPSPLALSNLFPVDTTACYALCATLFGRPVGMDEGLYWDCIHNSRCIEQQGNSYDFNNLIDVVTESGPVSTNYYENHIYYNLINRITGKADLKPTRQKTGYIVEFLTDFNTKEKWERRDVKLYISGGNVAPIHDDELRNCSKRCPSPFRCFNEALTDLQWDCYRHCVARGRLLNRTGYYGTFIYKTISQYDMDAMLNPIPAMDRLFYDQMAYITLNQAPDEFGDQYVSNCYNLSKCTLLSFYWHREHSQYWTSNPYDPLDNLTHNPFFLPLTISSEKADYEMADVNMINYPPLATYGTPLIEYTRIPSYISYLCSRICMKREPPAYNCSVFLLPLEENSCLGLCMKFLSMSFAPAITDKCTKTQPWLHGYYFLFQHFLPGFSARYANPI